MNGELPTSKQLALNFDLQSSSTIIDDTLGRTRPSLSLIVNNPRRPESPSTCNTTDPNSPEITQLIHAMGDNLGW